MVCFKRRRRFPFTCLSEEEKVTSGRGGASAHSAKKKKKDLLLTPPLGCAVERYWLQEMHGVI